MSLSVVSKRQYRLREYVPIVLVVVSLILQIIFNPRIHVLGNLMNILKQSSYTGIMAIGMLFVLIGGDVNLSLSSQFIFYGAFCAKLMNRQALPIFPSIVLTLLVALLLGALTGYLIERQQLNSMIATIALSVTVEGLSFVMTGGSPIFHLPEAYIRFNSIRLGELNVSLSLLVLILMGFLAAFILHRSFFGLRLYAVGSDRLAAARMGVSLLRTKVMAYAFCSLAVSISAMTYIGWIESAPLTISFHAELDVLTAAAVAGVGFSGGRGNVLPTVLGAIFLAVVSALLIALNIGPYYQNIIKGVILFAALLAKSPKNLIYPPKI